MPVAGSGPSLTRVRVNVTGSPTSTAVLPTTVLARRRSADRGVTATEAWSSSVGTPLPGWESGSDTADAWTWAVNRLAAASVTGATRRRVGMAPGATVPTVHRPVAGS